MILRAAPFLALALAAGMAVSATAAPNDKAPKHHEKADKKPHKAKPHHDAPKHDHPTAPAADHHPAPAPDSGHHDWGTYPH